MADVNTDLPLTARQAEIIEHIANGETMKVCARALGLSVRTVEAHIDTARKKLRAQTTPQLVALYLRRQQGSN